jgi:hypothetical protein
MRMRMRWLLCLTCVLSFCVPPQANAAVVEICNKGNTALNVARAIYSKSLLLGDSYHISGWYTVDAGKCEVLYSETDPDPIYLGFTYRDTNNGIRNYLANPQDPNAVYQAVAQNFCVGVGVVFDYTTKTKDDDGSCHYGFNYGLMQFTLYLGLDSSVGRASYTLLPDQNNRITFPLIGGDAASGAHLLLGEPVHLAEGKWRGADGAPLSDSLIDSNNLPPLQPRQQYSVSKAPVAGLIQQINNTLNGFQTCTDNSYNSTTPVSKSHFAMNDQGVVTSSYVWATDKTDIGVPIGSLDLASAAVANLGNCWDLQVKCKGGQACMQMNDNGEAHARRDQLDVYVNAQNQGVTILNALRGIAPSYPDTQGATQ